MGLVVKFLAISLNIPGTHKRLYPGVIMKNKPTKFSGKPGVVALLLLVAATPSFGGASRARETVPMVEASVSAPAEFDNLASIDSLIELRMTQYHLPGVAVGVVKGDSLIFSKGYGWADLDNRTPVTDTTIFMLASISKTFVGTALQQLIENGLVALDDPINDHLPFAVYNPNHPAVAITIKQLLTHTSGLNDNLVVMDETLVTGDSPIPLEQYCQDYFLPGGGYYDATENFRLWAPGSAWDYSNHGIVLAAYLIQNVTGMPFEDYCRDSIFTPLGMTNSWWFLEGLNLANIAVPYYWNGWIHI